VYQVGTNKRIILRCTANQISRYDNWLYIVVCKTVLKYTLDIQHNEVARIKYLRHKFLILDTCHLDTARLREKGCDDPRLFFEAERGPRAKTFGKHWPSGFSETSTK
jgi:hypothetical protein